MEPPRARPARGPRTQLKTLRIAALAAASVLAIASKGDVAVLAAALVIGAGSSQRRSVAVPATAAVAIVLALATASMRVGATSLRAISGAQSVLGPAGWNGSSAAVVATWLAAAAVLCAARPFSEARSWRATAPVALAFGSTAAAIAAGPGPGGAIAVRVAATIVATVVAGAVVAMRARPAPDTLVSVGGVLVGIAAIAFGIVAR